MFRILSLKDLNLSVPKVGVYLDFDCFLVSSFLVLRYWYRCVAVF